MCGIVGYVGPREAERILMDRVFAGAPEMDLPLESEVDAVTTIRPTRACQLINFAELWRFRELIYFLAWRDVKVRYKQTLLGAGWALLQPVLMMVVFTVFFRNMAQVPAGDLPYSLFAYVGLLPWMFFATAIANAGNSVVGSERLITKIYFPRLAIPFATVAAAVADFLIGLCLLVVMMAWNWQSISLSVNLLIVPFIFGMIMLAALGVGTLLAALNVAYRDFRYVIPFLVQFWMFATPTIYMQLPDAVSARITLLLAVNPMAGLIGAFRNAALGVPVNWGQLAVASACAVLLFLAGCFYFRKVEDDFADII
jgi:lipopolysaccharide transport system permease protein